MKWTPQKTMNSASCRFAASREQLQRVAGEVGELDDLVALVVMAQDDDARAERRFGGSDPRVHLVVREAQVFLRERLAFPDAFLLDLVEEFYVHLVSARAALHPGWLTALRGP